MTMTEDTQRLRSLRQRAIARLAEAGIKEAARDVDVLLEESLGLSALDFLLEPDQVVSQPCAEEFGRLLDRRLQREPVSQILGQRDFWSLRFKVTRDCLTPRPDSETLIEAALEALPDKTAPLDVIDFGTGSGCLLLSLLSEFPNARGTAVDLSQQALTIARENAQNLEYVERCHFLQSDWDAALPTDRRFDVVLCNPPYIGLHEAADLESDVREYEPHMALFAEEEGLREYRRLTEIIPRRIKPGGQVFLEIGHLQGAAVSELFAQTSAQNIRVLPDLAGRDRCVTFHF